MSRPILLSVAVLLLVSVLPAAAQQPTTRTFYLVLQTRIEMPMKMPGMAQMPQMPGMPTGAPTWSVSGRAVYDGTPSDPIFVAVPADLKLPDNKLVLKVPKPPQLQPGQGGEQGGEGTVKEVQITDKLYWHPDEAEGPVIETMKMQPGKTPRGMPGMAMPDLSRLIEELGHEADGEEGKLPANLKGSGDYVLNTGGKATMDGFLPPLKVTAPEKIVPEEGVALKWEPVPGARGYLVSAMGMNMEGNEDKTTQKMTTVSWFSTLVQPPQRIRGGYRQETTIADDLAKGILMPGNTTSCKVPPGVFEDIMFLRIKIEAVGNDFYNKGDKTTTFGTIRSEWNTTVFNMNMGGGGEE